jgi:hypothetical protein
MRRVGTGIWVVAIATIVALVVVDAPPAEAATCRVVDAETGDRSWGGGANLARALANAEPGDHLRISGVCRGNFDMPVRMRLSGDPTQAYPRPSLDGREDGSVLTVRNGGVLRSLIVRDGRARQGGGIFVNGSLQLRGTMDIRRNRAASGGGIFVIDGDVSMWDRSVVRRNRASGGGGISVQVPGHLTMRDRASVRRNVATSTGGGVLVDIGEVTMRNAAAVTGNIAGEQGGGIANWDGWSWFYGHARVTGNVAGAEGGGVFVFFGSGGVCSKHVRLSPNDPDDDVFGGVTGC